MRGRRRLASPERRCAGRAIVPLETSPWNGGRRLALRPGRYRIADCGIRAELSGASIWSFAMPDSDQRPEIEAPDELLADMPLPSDAKTFFLGGLFVLAMLTAVYVASEIVLPMIFAVMFNLLLQPALRALERLRVPEGAGIDFPHSCRVRDDRRNWRRGLRARRDVDRQVARGHSPHRAAAALSRRPDQYAQDISGGGQQFRRRGPAAKLGRAFRRRSDSVERLRRHAKLCRRAVHDRDVSLLPASGGGQFPAAAGRGFAQVRQQAAGGRHLAADRTAIFPPISSPLPS